MIQEPIQPIITPPSDQRPTGRDSGLRVGLVIALCFLLAVPILFAMAASRQQPAVLAVGASAAPQASAKSDDSDGPGNGHGPTWDKLGKGFAGFPGFQGYGGAKGGGAVRGPITIKSINGSDLALGTADGWSRTIAVTSDTKITKGGQPITLAGLAVGDEVRFSQTRNADGSYTITAIVVPTPVAGGVVSAVDATTITVNGKGGATRVITVTGATVYQLGKATGTKADVKVGTRVNAQGTVSGATFTAITVWISIPQIGGDVTAKTSDTITIKGRDGKTTVLHVTDKTTYEVEGKASATLSDIAVGDRVDAAGLPRADGSVDATSIEGRAPKPIKPAKPAVSAAPG